MSGVHLASSDLEDFRLKLGYVYTLFTLTANTTQASISLKSKNPGVLGFLEVGLDDGVQSTVDSGNTFGTLDVDADPCVIGVIVKGGDAAELYEARTTKVSSAALTAGTPTFCGASSSGVTLLKNLAVTVSLAGIDADANTNVHKFSQEFWYRKVS